MTCAGSPSTPNPDRLGAEDQAAEVVAAHGISEVPNDRGLSLVTRLEDCPLPDGYVIPEPYIVAPDGVHLMKDDGAGYARVAWAWLFPVRVYVDPDGDQLVELAWRDGARWVTRLIRRSLTKSGRKLIAEAGDAGLPVIEAEAKQAERWLAAAEAANRSAIARHPVARQLGWQADGKTFVTGQERPGGSNPGTPTRPPRSPRTGPNGTLAGWKDAIAEAREYIVVQVGAYAGLASPLLHPLGLDSFTVDFSGRSTRGKTITAMVALSCWADPSDRSEGMLTWQTASVIGIEKRLNLCQRPDRRRRRDPPGQGPGPRRRGPVHDPEEPRQAARRRLAEHDPVARRSSSAPASSPPPRSPRHQGASARVLSVGVRPVRHRRRRQPDGGRDPSSAASRRTSEPPAPPSSARLQKPGSRRTAARASSAPGTAS